MKDLSNVEIEKNDIVYYLAAQSGDLEYGEVLAVSDSSVAVTPLKLVEDSFGQQELHHLPGGPETTSSRMILVLPDAAQRIPILFDKAVIVY